MALSSAAIIITDWDTAHSEVTDIDEKNIETESITGKHWYVPRRLMIPSL